MFPGRTPESPIDAGYFKRAGTILALAQLCGIDAAQLDAAVARFNAMAHRGIDEDYHRGKNAYDQHYGDPRVKPNPNLAAIEKRPFYAVALYPGDLGTKGGLVTDENARVLRADGTPMEGLYASGNTTASVMGRSYPGGGATLGPALAFSFIAIQHMKRVRALKDLARQPDSNHDAWARGSALKTDQL
jgi:succinate dehydrogenase/fumarate reductase flavoprotein subunit